jgi:bifunctional non-homologous end joining protein LigD
LLEKYNQKRHFNETPEPKGKTKASKGALKFVIQKHDASHLHYDLRLEMEGVLKSWAVPKGPSLDPADKRLAMMVEDHPYDYRDFEGIIPEGNYGAGTVIVWDEGSYLPIGGEGMSRKQQEKLLIQQLNAGDLKIHLDGKKLKGDFALFLMKGRGERSWLLVKKKDDHSSTKDVLKQDRSVLTAKTLAEVAKENGTTPNHPESSSKKTKATVKPVQLLDEAPAKRSSKKAASKKSVPSKRPAKKTSTPFEPQAYDVSKKTSFPSPQKPMLATLVNEAFDDDDWIFEIKWDGYRALSFVKNSEVEVISRNLNSFTETYTPVTAALKELNVDVVLDGEIVAVNENGMADFQALQNWQNNPVQLQYYVFDILWLNGYDLSLIPLLSRKEILRKVIPEDHDILKFSDHVQSKGKDFFDIAIGKGLEGIMAKKADSLYHYGARTKDWVKIKVNLRQEVVIGGFTAPRNSRKNFGSLLLGVYEGDELRYIGHTGGGFDNRMLEQVHQLMKSLIVKKSPFQSIPKTNAPATWVKPELVCEIKFSEWTKEKIVRHPIFIGLREDKAARDVKFEKATNISEVKTKKSASKTTAPAKKTTAKKTTEKISPAKKTSAKKSAPSKRSAAKKSNRLALLDLSQGEDQELTINGHELKLTNLKKPYWKKEKFLKGDVLNYYLQIAPFILPYLKDRPQSLNRHPNGIDAPNFYQKDTKGKVPDWIQKHIDFSESTNKNVEYMVCTNEASLIYMANLGCIEMNPWHSRTASWENPDWCLIDLDPDTGNSFDQVIETANVVKEVLDAIGATSFVKTSGSSGIHIYIPLGAKYDFDQSKQLAELVVTIVNQQLPEFTSILRTPAKRKGKIYLDFLQNRQTQTAASPYCLRPKPGVPVSTPLDWSEVKKGLTPKTWTAYNIFDRLKVEGDLFEGVLGEGIDLGKVLAKMENI